MNKKHKILVIGDEDTGRLKELHDSGVELSQSSPLAIAVISHENKHYQFYHLTNDRRSRVYLSVYLELIQFDMVIYVCSALQTERDMKDWFKMLPHGTYKLLFLCMQAGYLDQCKIFDRVSSCFRRQIKQSLVFVQTRQQSLIEIISESMGKNIVRIDEYLRQTNAISKFKWLFRSKTQNSAI